MIFKSSLGSGMILHLWRVNPNLLLRGFLDAYNTDPDDMSRVLDICQELKVKTFSALGSDPDSCFSPKIYCFFYLLLLTLSDELCGWM